MNKKLNFIKMAYTPVYSILKVARTLYTFPCLTIRQGVANQEESRKSLKLFGALGLWSFSFNN